MEFPRYTTVERNIKKQYKIESFEIYFIKMHSQQFLQLLVFSLQFSENIHKMSEQITEHSSITWISPKPKGHQTCPLWRCIYMGV